MKNKVKNIIRVFVIFFILWIISSMFPKGLEPGCVGCWRETGFPFTYMEQNIISIIDYNNLVFNILFWLAISLAINWGIIKSKSINSKIRNVINFIAIFIVLWLASLIFLKPILGVSKNFYSTCGIKGFPLVHSKTCWTVYNDIPINTGIIYGNLAINILFWLIISLIINWIIIKIKNKIP